MTDQQLDNLTRGRSPVAIPDRGFAPDVVPPGRQESTMKTPVAWMTQEQYDAAPLKERALAWADSQNGVREKPVGSNKGPEVTEYQRVAMLGSKGGFAWCAAFVFWCLIKAGARKASLPASPAAVRNWVAWADKSGRIKSTPARGRLFFWVNTASGLGHIGLCLSAGDPFRTIEGNTNDAGSREGDGVYKKTRAVKKTHSKTRYGFIDLEGL